MSPPRDEARTTSTIRRLIEVRSGAAPLHVRVLKHWYTTGFREACQSTVEGSPVTHRILLLSPEGHSWIYAEDHPHSQRAWQAREIPCPNQEFPWVRKIGRGEVVYMRRESGVWTYYVDRVPQARHQYVSFEAETGERLVFELLDGAIAWTAKHLAPLADWHIAITE